MGQLVQPRPAALLARRHPSVEFEAFRATTIAPNPPISSNGSVAALPSKPANGLTTRRLTTTGVEFAANSQISPANARVAPIGIRSGREKSGQGTNGRRWPLRPLAKETYSPTATSTPTNRPNPVSVEQVRLRAVEGKLRASEADPHVA